jgi:hypothetical protein
VLRLRTVFLINLNNCNAEASLRGGRPRRAKKVPSNLRSASSSSGALGIGSPADGANLREVLTCERRRTLLPRTSVNKPS